MTRLVRRALHPPVRDARFWFVQVLVAVIAVGHEVADANTILMPLGIPSFATVGLFLIPIVYAALNFGLPGSFATAVLVTFLTVPDFYFVDRVEHHWIDGLQLGIIDAVAIFVGQRVERERLARFRAEEAGEAYHKAEARYRALFSDSPAPILVVSPDGSIRESNPAAQALVPKLAAPNAIQDVLGVSYRDLCEQRAELVRLPDKTDEVHDLRALCTPLETDEGPMVQVVLQDVTEELRERERIAAYAAHVVQVQEEERRRIGQEIHDEPLQSLIQVYRRLAGSREENPELLRLELADPNGPLAAVIDDLRELAHGLRPPALDDLGVVPALRRLVDEFSERNAVTSTFEVAGQSRGLSPDLGLSMFRIVQEALHNVERHAAARNVKIGLTIASGCVVIEVEDDGIGFDVKEAQTRYRGLGLIGMSERAQLLGGKLIIRSQPDGGALIRAELPVPPAEPGAPTFSRIPTRSAAPKAPHATETRTAPD